MLAKLVSVWLFLSKYLNKPDHLSTYFLCVDTWMALLFYAHIPGIINTARSEIWPHSTYLRHFALVFRGRNICHLASQYYATSIKVGVNLRTPTERCAAKLCNFIIHNYIRDNCINSSLFIHLKNSDMFTHFITCDYMNKIPICVSCVQTHISCVSILSQICM